jgi:phospholipid/cholesterol/gamma-HCH transport system substrate-binding protein
MEPSGTGKVNNRNFTVGLFVSFGLIALVTFTLWLSGGRGAAASVTYSLFFERDVSGLMLGGPVFYLGVEVGNVQTMKIIPGDPMAVRVDIDVLESTPVDTGTWASLYYQGITGVAVITLSGDPGMNLPLKTPPGFEYPVIEVRDSGLAAVLADAPGIMQKIDLLLEKANGLVSDENRTLVTETLSNLETLSGALAENEASFAGMPQSINATLSDVSNTLNELQKAVAEVRPGLGVTVDNLARATDDLARMVARLDAWTVDNANGMEGFMSEGLGQVPGLIDDTRTTLREVEKLMRSLREDPSQLIYRPVEQDDGKK